MKKLLTSLLLLATSTSLGASSMALRAPKSRLFKKADFQQDWQRSPAPDAIIQELFALFPDVPTRMYSNECQVLDEQNRSLLGDNNATTGFASVAQPNSSFVSWYVGCVTQLINSDNQVRFEQKINQLTGQYESVATEMRAGNAIDYLGADYSSTCAKTQHRASMPVPAAPRAGAKAAQAASATEPVGTFDDLRNCQWSAIQSSDQLAIINASISQFIGPEDVVNDLGLEKTSGELALKIQTFMTGVQNNSSLAPASLNLYYLSAYGQGNIRQEQISVLSAAKLAKFLILQTPFMKY